MITLLHSLYDYMIPTVKMFKIYNVRNRIMKQ
jgi:hypothetical protein